MQRPEPPSPDPADAVALDELADAIFAKAASESWSSIFSATGFSSENISIVHQQTRAANLA